LAVLLSVGFGLGVTFTVGRSLAYLVPAWWPAVIAGCIAAGIALTFWVIRTRSLLAERAALDRWSAELAAGVRAALEDQLVIQLLAAETALAARSGIGPSRDRT
jgi:predicted anti-sigma-YlaC factor YlaD